MRCLLDADALAWRLGPVSDAARDTQRRAWLAEAAFKALRSAWPVEVAAFDAQTGAAPSP